MFPTQGGLTYRFHYSGVLVEVLVHFSINLDFLNSVFFIIWACLLFDLHQDATIECSVISVKVSGLCVLIDSYTVGITRNSEIFDGFDGLL